MQTAAASGATTRTLAKAIELAAGMKDDFAATEHLLLALAEVDSLGPHRADRQRGDRVGTPRPR